MYMYNNYLLGDLAGEEKQYFSIQRGIESLQKDMVRLNSLITDKRGEQDQLEQGNILIEKDFISSLKVKTLLLYASLIY